MTIIKIFLIGFVGLFFQNQPTEPIVTSTQKVAIPDEGEEVNQLDQKGQRHGLWVIKKEARMGEPSATQMGFYEHGAKMGTWYTFDQFKILVAAEQYKFDELNGSVKYYDKYGLLSEGQYLGRNTELAVDTIIATHPLTFMDTLVPVFQDMGSFKHGVWNYYNSTTKQLIKREFFQVGDLIKYEEVPLKETMDSTFIEQRIQKLPHNQSPKKRHPKARNSLIK